MSRLGEGELFMGSRRVGKIWVRALKAEAAFRPRLQLLAGCQLHDVPRTEMHPDGVEAFGIAVLGGQLRWQSATGEVVGDLSIAAGLEHVRSSADPLEHEFTMCCDVPHQVLSRLEAERAGAAPTFWMSLTGSWATKDGIKPIYQRPWEFTPPLPMWLSFLAESGSEDFDFVELRRFTPTGDSLQAAIDHLQAARRLTSSDPPKAVGLCRQVIEAWEEAMNVRKAGEMREYLTACTDKKRGEEYSHIFSALKQLAGLRHHHFGRHSTFARHEALALVRICEALVLMFGELTPAQRPNSAERDDQ